MRSYTILLTILLTVSMAKMGFTQAYGIASYIDDSMHGRVTASGELYNKNELTAAYNNHPFNTILRVTRLDNKKSVRVRIIDRGPYIKGRLIEISKAAAERLGMVDTWEAEVRVDVVDEGANTPVASTNIETGDVATTPVEEFDAVDADLIDPRAKPEIPKIELPAEDPPRAESSSTSSRPSTSGNTVTTTPKASSTASAKAVVADKAEPKVSSTSPPPAKPITTSAPLVRKGDYRTYDLYKIQILRPERNGYAVQVASITNYANVLKQVAELQDKWFKNILISVEKGAGNEPVYKILLGPLPDQKTAEAYKKRLKEKKNINGFTVNLSEISY